MKALACFGPFSGKPCRELSDNAEDRTSGLCGLCCCINVLHIDKWHLRAGYVTVMQFVLARHLGVPKLEL